MGGPAEGFKVPYSITGQETRVCPPGTLYWLLVDVCRHAHVTPTVTLLSVNEIEIETPPELLSNSTAMSMAHAASVLLMPQLALKKGDRSCADRIRLSALAEKAVF